MTLLTLCPFAIAFFVSVLIIPGIIHVADEKHLMDEPDSSRKLHVKNTPTLGGIAIFAGTMFSYAAMSDFLEVKYEIKLMVPALLLLFFAGVKDDILILSPLKKLFVQFVCAALLTVVGNMRITSLWGMFGITDIPPVTGTILTFMVIVALINAFNLIDGIDGLAGGLGLIASIFFGSWFALTHATLNAVLSFSLAGSLLGFLVYNYNKAKIFMGDTGSMILGFIIAILAIKFIEDNRVPEIVTSPLYIKAAPGVAIATVMVPLLDMARVFFQRILSKKHPFKADRNHIHHIMIDLGLTPQQTVIVLYLIAVLFIALAIVMKELRSMNLAVLLLLLGSLLEGAVLLLHHRMSNRKEKMARAQ